MNAPPPTPRARAREGFTEQDVCSYAHHLWIATGMSFDGDPWAEARACLAANLPPAPARSARRTAPGGGLKTARSRKILTW